jgi:DNA (cytosine-5)-methyltransferase 1
VTHPGLVFGSVCSGIEAASTAWEPLGWRCAFAAEIEPFPRAVLAHRFPHTPLRGDFTEIQAGEHDAIDALVGGTPCQSFSIAGLRGGMADQRGNLALEYLRLADRLRPRWLLWENVPGVLSSWSGDHPPSDLAEGSEWETEETSDFGCFVAGLAQLGYGIAYRVLDAQYFGLAQRRQRVFVVGYLGDWRRAAAVLFEPASLRGHPPPSRKSREGIAGTATARAGNGSRPAGGNGNLTPDVIGALAGTSPGGGWRIGADEAAPGHIVAFGDNNSSGPVDIATACNAHGGSGRMDFESETVITHALRADGFDASEDGTGRGTPLVPVAFRTSANCGAWETGDRTDALTTGTDRAASIIALSPQQITSPQNRSNPRDGDPCHALAASAHPPAIAQPAAVRRLTPRECERLQGFPDDHTRIPVRHMKAKPHTLHFQKYPDLYDKNSDGTWTRYAADGPRYKALGNSMAVPVMRWIGERIAAEDARGPTAPITRPARMHESSHAI